MQSKVRREIGGSGAERGGRREAVGEREMEGRKGWDTVSDVLVGVVNKWYRHAGNLDLIPAS